MWDVAIVYESAFERMVVEDPNYEIYFKNDGDEALWDNTRKKKNVNRHPEGNDFTKVKCFIRVLKIYYDVTMKISGSKYCTSNLFFIELVKMQDAIMKLCSNEDLMMRDMAKRMKEKYDKYWDNLENTNFLLYVSVVLDPRYKKQYLDFCLAKLYGRGSSKSSLMCEKIMKTLHDLFDHYKSDVEVDTSSSSPHANHEGECDDDFEKYAEEQEIGGTGKSEIDMYLMDGRLSTRTSEALVCTQDWLRNSEKMVDLSEVFHPSNNFLDEATRPDGYSL